MLALMLTPFVAAADSAGLVTHFSGVLSAQKTDGKLKILGMKSEVEPGDILMTGKDSYAQIKFADGSQLTLRPESRIRVEDFRFDKARPEQDSAIFSLIKGGLRAISGLISKRGNRDSYQMRTSTATIGIRGTHYGALLCQDDCGGLQAPSAKPMENGLYVDVAEGAIAVSNGTGSHSFAAGQFGYVRDANAVPATLPADPGGLRFNPPSAPAEGKSKGETGQTQPTECVVAP